VAQGGVGCPEDLAARRAQAQAQVDVGEGRECLVHSAEVEKELPRNEHAGAADGGHFLLRVQYAAGLGRIEGPALERRLDDAGLERRQPGLLQGAVLPQ
jgi:hypothetical protein